MMRFNDVVEAIKGLSIDEKQEISMLLQQYLREESRDNIYKNFQVAQQEEKQGNLKFSNQIDKLKKMIEE
ncbi:MAG: hypothetical protein P5702_06235 [Limnospira sp. PMC 1291.21]|uniref:Uncharacterized protein n=3 Tax=Limnospira TaxID=2596745 RepID=B5W501_LIMMA|nr:MULTISPECIES: hypothetical protein [Limnospira]EKD07536.1 hypothetical protein SPLC1_S412030 [Arthrospira platensis C1]MDC0837802.1 hypothetical protein [Limnoraphis robusta]MDY7051898.1 hypothetical protein [Limnospira fusiformis LS22]QJB25844.1 hypothetical protein HFV01_08575 [Limnospira fusiformis SAG 85.79]RAQ44879.1 hypothetical protein B9S53_08410 [Arthrospira sp. O9.13F]